MKTVYLEKGSTSVKIHDIDDSALKRHIVPPISGLEFPEIRINSFEKAGQDGIHVTSSFLGERRITINGIIKASTNSELIEERQEIFSILNPSFDDDGILEPITLRFTDQDNQEYRVQCIAGSRPVMEKRYLTYAEFQIDLLATNTGIENSTQDSQVVSLYSGGGATVPFTVPVSLTAGQGGEATINNEGNMPAYAIVTFNGKLTNPRLDNTTVGKHVALQMTITSGVSIVVDMEKRTVVQGGVTNRINKLSDTSDFFALKAGNNVFRLTSSVSGESGNATIQWYDTWLGV